MKEDVPPVFTFANGIRVRTKDLLEQQIERYASLAAPLHEPVEEEWFDIILSTAPERGAVFVDIGCALGYYTVLVRKRLPGSRVMAVDPNPQFAEGFRETLLLNGLSPASVDVVTKAVGVASGRVPFSLKRYGSHVAGPSMEGAPDTIEVEATSLDDLLDTIPESIFLVKMDIQGHEQKVLESSSAVRAGDRVRHWIIGTHGRAVHESVVGILQERHDILFSDPCPPHQPDGIVVARAR